MTHLFRWWRERAAKARRPVKRAAPRPRRGFCASRGARLTRRADPHPQGLPADGWLTGNKAPTPEDFACAPPAALQCTRKRHQRR